LVAIQITDPDTKLDPNPDPFCDTAKTCLGGGMHCPIASSFYRAMHISAKRGIAIVILSIRLSVCL